MAHDDGAAHRQGSVVDLDRERENREAIRLIRAIIEDYPDALDGLNGYLEAMEADENGG